MLCGARPQYYRAIRYIEVLPAMIFAPNKSYIGAKSMWEEAKGEDKWEGMEGWEEGMRGLGETERGSESVMLQSRDEDFGGPTWGLGNNTPDSEAPLSERLFLRFATQLAAAATALSDWTAKQFLGLNHHYHRYQHPSHKTTLSTPICATSWHYCSSSFHRFGRCDHSQSMHPT